MGMRIFLVENGAEEKRESTGPEEKEDGSHFLSLLFTQDNGDEPGMGCSADAAEGRRGLNVSGCESFGWPSEEAPYTMGSDG